MLKKKKNPLFGGNQTPSCEYCAQSSTEGGLHCTLNSRGCSGDANCRRFVYDPLRRIPHKTPPLPKVDPKDFKL